METDERTHLILTLRQAADVIRVRLSSPVSLALADWLSYHADLRETGRYHDGAPGDKQAVRVAELILGREQDK